MAGFQIIHDPADIPVHGRHAGIITLDVLPALLLIVRLGPPGFLPRMAGRVGDIRKLTVIVKVPYLPWLVLLEPGVMGRRVMDAEIEGLFLVVLQKPQGVVRNDVRHIPLFYDRTSVPHVFRKHVIGAAPGNDLPEGKAFLGFIGIAQMPFACKAAGIPALFQDFRVTQMVPHVGYRPPFKIHVLLVGQGFLKAHFSIHLPAFTGLGVCQIWNRMAVVNLKSTVVFFVDGSAAQPVQDTVLGGHFPGEDGCPGRRTHRTGAEKVLKPQALPGHPVQHRRMYFRIPVASQAPAALVIAEDHDNVHLFCISHNISPSI